MSGVAAAVLLAGAVPISAPGLTESTLPTAQPTGAARQVQAQASGPGGEGVLLSETADTRLAVMEAANSGLAEAGPDGQSSQPAEPDREIVVSGAASNKGDPVAAVNAASFQAIQAVDKAFIGPVANIYEHGIPKPLRMGLRNFLRNLEQPFIAANFLLQLKPVSAVKAVARFGINSTIGVGGLVDAAKRKPFGLPYRPNGFANTLACYGLGPGPFLFLPLFGAITLRDLFGLTVDRATLPIAVGSPFNRKAFNLPMSAVNMLNKRVEMDSQIEEMRRESGNPYEATRDLYLKQRRAEIVAICPRKGDAPPDPSLPPRAGKGVD